MKWYSKLAVQSVSMLRFIQRDEVVKIVRQHWAALNRLGVRSLSIFGSIARDEARSDSDVDVLVEIESPITFDRYMDVKIYLEDHLRTRVDLVSWRSLFCCQVERRLVIKCFERGDRSYLNTGGLSQL